MYFLLYTLLRILQPFCNIFRKFTQNFHNSRQQKRRAYARLMMKADPGCRLLPLFGGAAPCPIAYGCIQPHWDISYADVKTR